MKFLSGFASIWSLTLVGCAHQQGSPPISSEECFSVHTAALATDEMEGRGAGTEGLAKAANYIEAQLADANVTTQRQTFQVTTGIALGEGNRLAWGEEERQVQEGFMPLGFSASADFEGEVVFAGFGITADDLDYDDYKDVNVEGKVVLAFRYEPGEDDPESAFDGKRPTRWSDLRHKAHVAKNNGAKALIFVAPPAERDPDSLPGLRTGGPTSDAGIPVLQVTREVADMWVASAGKSLAELRQTIDSSYEPASFAIPELVLSGSIRLDPTREEVSNIIGVVPGSGSLKDEVVVVGAHYDHLGYGGSSSFSPDLRAIHNGADDNASGVAAMLCAVDSYQASLPDERRTLVAMAFTAEELGLGGSGQYVHHPVFPIEKTVAMVNLDMVGRLEGGTLQALGTDSAKEWEGWLQKANQETSISLAHGGDGYGPSDHSSFYGAGVPVVHLFTGSHKQYHSPEDDVDLLDNAGGGQIATLLESLLDIVVTEGKPGFVKSTSGPTMVGDSRGYGSYLGSIPDYATMMNEAGGVLLGDVRADSPASRAGLTGGDRIVGMAGVEINNLYDMTFVLRDHRPGDRIAVQIVRGDETLDLHATLGSRSAKPKGSSHGSSPHGGAHTASSDSWKPTAGKDASNLLLKEEKHFANLRQLTFGGENAEAYFSPDGTKLIFQRTPPDGGCDQQYIYDLADGSTTLVSSGKGRTTCGYYSYPDGDRFIYATTEGGSEECPPVPDHSQGYVWPLYDSFEIVWTDEAGGSTTPFAPSPGYDAEATICQQDGRVVFTSVRDGDLELYSANADGSNLKRLTSTPGYDGGAFYTHDCEHIVWRASRPTGDALADYNRLLGQGLVRPSSLELFVMKADGTDVQQLTDNGKANFGPYPTPGDKGIIFSSNLGGSAREFDLYTIPMNGGEPEQITFAEGFDGFPMFSPDGKWFVFASNRGGTDHETNLFIAEWNE